MCTAILHCPDSGQYFDVESLNFFNGVLDYHTEFFEWFLYDDLGGLATQMYVSSSAGSWYPKFMISNFLGPKYTSHDGCTKDFKSLMHWVSVALCISMPLTNLRFLRFWERYIFLSLFNR